MSNSNENIKKICSFYVSEWHLISMVLPYISGKLDANKTVTNISEEKLSNFVKKFVSKLNLNEAKQKQILNINWDNRKMDKIEGKEIIIISGTREYIEKVNEALDKKIQEIKKEITIINCYEVMQFNNNINEILDKHDKVLNTSGERKICEVFDGYKRRKAINE